MVLFLKKYSFFIPVRFEFCGFFSSAGTWVFKLDQYTALLCKT